MPRYDRLFLLSGLLALATAPLIAQQGSKPGAAGSVRVTPAEVTLPIGQTVRLQAEALDVGGRPIAAEMLFLSLARRSVSASSDGELKALLPGRFEVIVRAMLETGRGPEARVIVTVPQPDPARIAFDQAPAELYVGTGVRVTAVVTDDNGVPRADLPVTLASSDDAVFAVDPFGNLSARRPGTADLVATGGGLEQRHHVEVLENPVTRLELAASSDRARTGDVVHFTAALTNGRDEAVDGVPVLFTFVATPDDHLGNAATGQIEQDGRFVAEAPGLYTIVATCGQASDRLTIRCDERITDKQKLVKVGHGAVLDVHTSDLWVWEGSDGRDYAVTGTWGANGDAIFWDVTDPSRIEQIAVVTVDARTVNDVKVSADGRLCIISREGASNRKNGIVAFDVSDPRKPERLSEYDDELTGGVHNLFLDKGYAYALSAGRRYDILDIRDPRAPLRVGSYQVFEPGASIHDVWVEDGIAYSSNWRYGLHLVDVGNGIKGGSPSNPVLIGNYAYPSGWNHAAFPWRSKDTGRFYVVAGDEAFPHGLFTKDHPTYARGWIHFVDFTDLEHPREVARYQVPEAGTHNLWIEGNTMYVAYYNGGVRVVDISGELMGDLYRQGRELGWFLPTHPKGVVPNAPMVWGPQPHKGTIFFSDWNSGLWAVKLVADAGRR
ncbi:MAG: hypothetical protein KDC98_26400 [Planctomycetes bacterium]|nr:hypothetical protein [Planctomycetota bacterium]